MTKSMEDVAVFGSIRQLLCSEVDSMLLFLQVLISVIIALGRWLSSKLCAGGLVDRQDAGA